MIRGIVAMDKCRGIANQDGIPWNLPTDKRYFREKTFGSIVLMGYSTYAEFEEPLEGRTNLVATTRSASLKEGFSPVPDAREYLKVAEKDVWVIGGSKLFEKTIDLIEEFYITEIDHDFNCTKFLIEFENAFKLKESRDTQEENSIQFRFKTYIR